MICSLKCGFRKTWHKKLYYKKTWYWLMEWVIIFKPDYETKIKVYYTDHWILSSFFCIQGNHSNTTKAYFPEIASLETFIIIPFYNAIAAVYYFKLAWTENRKLNSPANATKLHSVQNSGDWSWFLPCNKDRVYKHHTMYQQTKDVHLWKLKCVFQID